MFTRKSVNRHSGAHLQPLIINHNENTNKKNAKNGDGSASNPPPNRKIKLH
jgi:hypothetical protein